MLFERGALLFIIDPTPYQIKFDEDTAQAREGTGSSRARNHETHARANIAED